MATKKICDGCKRETSNLTECKIGSKKFEVCPLCKNRIIEFLDKPKGLDLSRIFRG